MSAGESSSLFSSYGDIYSGFPKGYPRTSVRASGDSPPVCFASSTARHIFEDVKENKDEYAFAT